MKIFRFLVSFIFFVSPFIYSDACTSAIVSGKITKDGRPLLWKNRDTGNENNKVERILASNGNMEYIALFNADDIDNKEAWMGMNTAGFAIMNTASYNIKNDNVKDMDKEGFIMTEALKCCHTVDDFDHFLTTHKKPLGVEANFGVIDASGNAAYFESNNTSFTRFNVDDNPDGLIVRTNYSHSGRKNEGYGFVREKTALALLKPHIAATDITPATFTEELSRSFYHSLLGIDFSKVNLDWAIDQDFIPRNSSSATCVIQGILPNEDPSLSTMWIGIGYPPCSKIRAAWTGENGVPSELRGTMTNGHSPLCDATIAKKNEIFPISYGNGKKYIAISKLYNNEGNGYCQILIPQNLNYYNKINNLLDKKRAAKLK